MDQKSDQEIFDHLASSLNQDLTIESDKKVIIPNYKPNLGLKNSQNNSNNSLSSSNLEQDNERLKYENLLLKEKIQKSDARVDYYLDWVYKIKDENFNLQYEIQSIRAPLKQARENVSYRTGFDASGSSTWKSESVDAYPMGPMPESFAPSGLARPPPPGFFRSHSTPNNMSPRRASDDSGFDTQQIAYNYNINKFYQPKRRMSVISDDTRSTIVPKKSDKNKNSNQENFLFYQIVKFTAAETENHDATLADFKTFCATIENDTHGQSEANYLKIIHQYLYKILNQDQKICFDIRLNNFFTYYAKRQCYNKNLPYREGNILDDSGWIFGFICFDENFFKKSDVSDEKEYGFMNSDVVQQIIGYVENAEHKKYVETLDQNENLNCAQLGLPTFKFINFLVDMNFINRHLRYEFPKVAMVRFRIFENLDGRQTAVNVTFAGNNNAKFPNCFQFNRKKNEYV